MPAVRLTTDFDSGDYDPAWSPDGQRIAFSSHRGVDGWGIYVMNADGSDVTRLTTEYFDSASVSGDPAWSPDGQRIAFSRQGAIHVMNADGSKVKRLTHNYDDDYAPAWSPDGQRIAFQSNRDGDWGIYVMNVDGSDFAQLTQHSSRVPAWSPDGQRIAFEYWADIHVMNADGSGFTQLTHASGWNTEPAWSPDGQRIAFRSTRVGRYGEIYVMNAAGEPGPETSITRSQCRGTAHLTLGYTSVWIDGTVFANKTVSELRIRGYANGAFVGEDYIGDLSAGQSEEFEISGTISEAGLFMSLNCDVTADYATSGSDKVTVGDAESSQQVRVHGSLSPSSTLITRKRSQP